MNVGIGLKTIEDKYKINLEKCELVVIGQKKNSQWIQI
jgi:hypothetical protein